MIELSFTLLFSYKSVHHLLIVTSVSLNALKFRFSWDIFIVFFPRSFIIEKTKCWYEGLFFEGLKRENLLQRTHDLTRQWQMHREHEYAEFYLKKCSDPAHSSEARLISLWLSNFFSSSLPDVLFVGSCTLMLPPPIYMEVPREKGNFCLYCSL